MDRREKLIKDISVFLADKLLELSDDEGLPELPTNGVHFERTLTALQDTLYLLEYQVSNNHGYRVQFDELPADEQLEGILGVFTLSLLRKEITTDRFTLGGEKRVFVFPSQVMDTIKHESLQLEKESPTTYGLLNEQQFSNWG